MTAVVIGVDPAKRSHAMAVLDRQEQQLAALQVTNDSAGYRAMLALAKRWKDRVWAIEGAGGVGVHLAQRLVADGERVLDVPPTLSTRARIFDRGHGRKNDPVDEGVDLGRVDVQAQDLVAELGHAHGVRGAEVAGADDSQTGARGHSATVGTAPRGWPAGGAALWQRCAPGKQGARRSSGRSSLSVGSCPHDTRV